MQTSLLFKNNGLVFVFKSHNPLVVGSNPTGPTNQINALRKQGIFSCRNCVQFVSEIARFRPIPQHAPADVPPTNTLKQSLPDLPASGQTHAAPSANLVQSNQNVV